jgi:hypothetical protein
MKNVVLLRIDFDGRDQDTYEDVACSRIDDAGHMVETRRFASGDPTRDWTSAIHHALSLRVPVLRDSSCESFVAAGDEFSWGNPKMKIVMRRRPANDEILTVA